jgi:hypothetical protein
MAVDLRREPLLFVERDLSKSLFLAGVQCAKRLWLEVHRPDLAAPPEAVRRAAMAEGVRVGALARERHPGGVLVAETSGAGRATRAAIASGAPAIFEAAFRARGVRVRADLLVRLPSGGFELAEVKASTRVRAEHELDLALQLVVARAAGVTIDEATILHLDRDYRWRGGALDLERLFARRPLADPDRKAAEVEMRLGELAPVLGQETAPAIEIGPHCRRPRICPFFEVCHGEPPGAERGRSPVDLETRIGERARRAIERARAPIRCLDVEAFAPAIPRFPPSRPYEAIPFLWSIVTLGESGETADAREFLAPPGPDPRASIAASLLDALGAEGTILVYSDFERRLLADLAELFPDLAAALAAASARILDVHALLDRTAGDRTALAALSPADSIRAHRRRPIRDGGEAAAVYAALADRKVAEDVARADERRLRDYCRRDAEALALLHRRIKAAR